MGVGRAGWGGKGGEQCARLSQLIRDVSHVQLCMQHQVLRVRLRVDEKQLRAWARTGSVCACLASDEAELTETFASLPRADELRALVLGLLDELHAARDCSRP